MQQQDAFEFVSAPQYSGSNSMQINVKYRGRPYGALWSFKETKTESFGWHAKKLNGEYAFFDPRDYGSKKAAQKAARAWFMQ